MGHLIEMRTLLPAYPAIVEKIGRPEMRPVAEVADLFGGPANLLRHGDLVLVDAPHLYDRPGNPYLGPDGYDWPDNARRFAGLSWMAHEIGLGRYEAALGGWRPDIVHGHDWQAALTAAYLRFSGEKNCPSTVLTIHNLAFQGLFDADQLGSLRLPASRFTPEGLEFYGRIGFLKAGIVYSDAITTVSPTYSREIQTPEHGMGLDGLLRSRGSDLFGIVNGIDTTVWDPAADKVLPEPYSKPSGKAASKRLLQQKMELDADDAAPLFCVISRLTRQKGLDLLLESLDALFRSGGQLALLGSGDSALEAGFKESARSHAGRMACVIGYDEPLAHLMQAGADAIIIPSRFEPCGLTQLCALRYGTIPIVARVGGLADTVIDANPAALMDGVATGVQFIPVDGLQLAAAIERFATLYGNRTTFEKMRLHAMGRRLGWDDAACQYLGLYENLL